MTLPIPRTIIILPLLLLMSTTAICGELEDGFMAYEQGDNALAHKKWLSLAIKGDARAQFFLSVLFENRSDSLEDKDNAKKWLTASANSGFVPARFNLGNNYYQGRYGAVDNKMAEYWWSQAAIQGLVEAQYQLASLYYWGKRGVKLNLKEAFYWFEQASKNGSREAVDAVLLLRAGEPLPVSVEAPENIAYDDQRIITKLSLDGEQLAIINEKNGRTTAAPARVDTGKSPVGSVAQMQKVEAAAPTVPEHERQDAEVAPTPNLTAGVNIPLQTEVSGQADMDWVSRQPAANYTIQLYASTRMNECMDYIERLYRGYQLETHVQSFIKKGQRYCAVIYASHTGYAEAKADAAQLPREIKQAKPWIRKMAR